MPIASKQQDAKLLFEHGNFRNFTEMCNYEKIEFGLPTTFSTNIRIKSANLVDELPMKMFIILILKKSIKKLTKKKTTNG
jgi:hypothetical protein